MSLVDRVAPYAVTAIPPHTAYGIPALCNAVAIACSSSTMFTPLECTRSAHVDLPRAVLGIVADLDARIVLVEQQHRRPAVVGEVLRFSPLALEHLEQRLARLGVRLVRNLELELGDLAADRIQRDARRDALPFRRRQHERELLALLHEVVLVRL